MDLNVALWALIGGLAYSLTGYYRNHAKEGTPFDVEKFVVTILLSTTLGVIGALTGYSTTGIIDQILITAPTFAGLTAMIRHILDTWMS